MESEVVTCISDATRAYVLQIQNLESFSPTKSFVTSDSQKTPRDKEKMFDLAFLEINLG